MKPNRLVLAIIAATALVAANSVLAQETTSNAVAGVTIRGGSSNVVASSVLLANTTQAGVLEVKSSSSTGSGTRKSYVQFDVGANPNTNANATFTIPLSGAPISQAIRVILWGLNQAAPTMGPSTTWNTAQANWTNTDYLWVSAPTNGTTATATPISTNIVPAYSNPSVMSYSFTLAGGPNGWGQYVKSSGGSNTITFGLTGIFDIGYNGAPVRIPTVCCFAGTAPLPGYWSPSSLTFWQKAGGGSLPSISLCTNVTTYPTLNSPTNYFTVSPGGLTPTATSDNQTAVPDANIYISGSGANWSVYVVAGNSPGSANITLAITDGSGNPANSTFKVTVSPVEPFFSSKPADTNTLSGVALTVPFAVYEPTSNANNITIWATSLNTNLVPDSGLSTATVPGTGGTNRTVTITPLAGTNGIAPIALWVSDGSSSNRTAFAVQVRPSTNVVFFDAFAYTTNLTSGKNDTLTNGVGRLDLASGSFWQVRGGTTPAIFVIDGQAQVTYPSSSTTPQSLIAPLVGGPYPPGKASVFITKFKAKWTAALPSTNSTSIVSLYDETAGSTTGLRGRLSTTNTASGFRVRIQNSEGGLYTEFPQELNVGTTYTIWLKYDVDGAETQLWVDPVSEASPSVLNTDTAGGRVIYDVSLRQGSDTGPVLIDDLLVTITNRPIVSPVITSLSVSNAVPYQAILFTGDTKDPSSAFTVWHASDVSGPWSDSVAGLNTLAPGSFSATVNDTNTTKFYRVKRY